MKNKICVYTCITGGYDSIKDIKKEKGVDYFCFTNNPNLKSKTWKVIQVHDNKLNDSLLSRKIKILGHPVVNKYDVAVWIDGSVSFDKKIADFVKTYFSKSTLFAGFKHGERNNVEEECYECVRVRKASRTAVKKLLKFYQKEKYPMDNGLIEATVHIKRPGNPLVKKTLKIWFHMVKNYVGRDQLSFNYAIWKTDLPVLWIYLKVFDNDWFTCSSHGYDKQISSYRVYFDDEKAYNLDHDYAGKMTKRKNHYSISLKSPCDTQKIVLEFSKIPHIEMSNFRVNKKPFTDIRTFNASVDDGTVFFYNDLSTIHVMKKLKKGERITFDMDLKLIPFGDAVRKTSEFIYSLEGKLSMLNERNRILESRSGRGILRRIYKKFFRRHEKIH
jgi:hypothetical protein